MFVAESPIRGDGQRVKFRAASRWIGCLLAFLCAPLDVSFAQEAAASDQQRLYEQMERQPTNYDVTSAYVKVATAHGDYEAAISALERLLYYNSDLPQVKYELGALYYRLGAFEMARRYFREALANPRLAPAMKARIETNLADADKATQQSRLAVFAQLGVRYQTNASYAPASGIVRFEGQDYGLLSSQSARGDTNNFGLFGVSHDYDLQNGTLETRFIGYVSQQYHLTDLDVGLFDISVGPRVALAPDLFPGVTIKPYVVGGDSWVGGSPYLASMGGGVSIGIPVGPHLSFEPNVELRRVSFNGSDPLLSSFNSGAWLSAGVASSYIFSDQLRIDARAYYRRGMANENYQSFNQWVGEAALPFQFAPPFVEIPRAWMISPFGRIVRTSFDAANPYIDATTTRDDTEWIGGLVLVTPITQTLGVSTTAQFDYVDSTITNYRQNNFSILTGPTARF
jgi:tetratricopeptide (TPR) repeat protein